MIDFTDTPLVFLDVETTGFSPTKCRVIEVAAIRVEKGQIVGRLTSFINPECELPEVITKITGITDIDLKYASLFVEVAPRLTRILDGAVLVAHSAKFDYSFLKAEFERIRWQFAMKALCTVELSRALYPRLSSHKLGEMIAHFGFEVDERHRAEADASVLMQIMDKAREEFGADRLQREVARAMI